MDEFISNNTNQIIEDSQQESFNSRNQGFSQNYYESPKKKEKSGIGIKHLIIVALVCSILGGGFVFALYQFVAPAVQPSIASLFGKWLTAGIEDKTASATNPPVQTVQPINVEGLDPVNAPIVAVANNVTPSIVRVNVKATVRDYIFGTQEVEGGGSGIIISEDGYIITNNHVIEGAMSSAKGTELAGGAEISVILTGNEDKPYNAKVVGRDESTDIAVLKIEESNLLPAKLGDSDSIKQGEIAIAIGYPGGFSSTITVGYISGLDRIIEFDGREMTLIQTDAAINPGNSGGALVNIKGEVIGINTVKISGVEYEGLGFAIPINFAKGIAEELKESPYIVRPYLGVSLSGNFTEEIAKQNNVPMGALVIEVYPFTAAFEAGIKYGDIITEIDGVRVMDTSGLKKEIGKHKVGDTIEVKVYRETEYLTLQAKLGEESK
ncbi:MAG: trypsin-like peptidase domain-containing protein [Eubacteriales bacterium]|nr:trypsin-like peptidase domain-containing protein [Eubacteriales bacterium]